MGERRLVRTLQRNHNATADEQLRRLVEHRERVAALLRARPRVVVGEVAAYRSSYAARLWALGEASTPVEPAEAGRAHLSLVTVADPDPSKKP
jgi:hypothetical protein